MNHDQTIRLSECHAETAPDRIASQSVRIPSPSFSISTSQYWNVTRPLVATVVASLLGSSSANADEHPVESAAWQLSDSQAEAVTTWNHGLLFDAPARTLGDLLAMRPAIAQYLVEAVDKLRSLFGDEFSTTVEYLNGVPGGPNEEWVTLWVVPRVKYERARDLKERFDEWWLTVGHEVPELKVILRFS